VSTSSVLEVRGLRAGYGRVQVVNDVSLRIVAGEVVALVGRNGAGKTTTLAAMAGLRYGPSEGSVHIDDHDVTKDSPHQIVLGGVNLVPEGRRVFREMSVAENLRLGAFTRRRIARNAIGEDLERVYELFPALALYKTKVVGELSGGQQQMVAIGQKLMTRPKFLLLDEPTSGLAPALVDELYDRFLALAHEGIGLLVVDQSVERVFERSERFYVMDDGRIVQSGLPSPAALESVNSIIMGLGELKTL
jgi:branched-chain amino acid transport system ATP-binding protein